MPTILITGVSRGFGRELVQVFAARGWRVFGVVRRPKDAIALEDAIAGEFHAIRGDVTSDEVVADIQATLRKRGGSLDVLVNNAGIPGEATSLDDATCDELQRLLDVHCLGALRCTKACMPFLEASPRPLVINMTSRLGSMSRNASGEFAGQPFSYSYRIAKAAQNMLTLCLSQEFADRNVVICAVHPGKLKTDSAAHDANVDPGEAAERLALWIESADVSVHGRYLDLSEGEIAW